MFFSYYPSKTVDIQIKKGGYTWSCPSKNMNLEIKNGWIHHSCGRFKTRTWTIAMDLYEQVSSFFFEFFTAQLEFHGVAKYCTRYEEGQ